MSTKYLNILALLALVLAVTACSTDDSEPIDYYAPATSQTECFITFNEDFLESVEVTANWMDCEGNRGSEPVTTLEYRRTFTATSFPSHCGISFSLRPKDNLEKDLYVIATDYGMSVNVYNGYGDELRCKTGVVHVEYKLTPEQLAPFIKDAQSIPLGAGVNDYGEVEVSSVEI